MILPDIEQLPLLRFTIFWTTVPGASGYRIYRAGPNESVSDLRPIAEVVGFANTTYIDRGVPAFEGRGPLQPGDIGQWDLRLANLTTARHRHAVAALPKPGSPSEHLLYVIGGDSGSELLDTAEVITINIAEDTQPTSDAWLEFQYGTGIPPRADHSLWLHTPVRADIGKIRQK